MQMPTRQEFQERKPEVILVVHTTQFIYYSKVVINGLLNRSATNNTAIDDSSLKVG